MLDFGGFQNGHAIVGDHGPTVVIDKQLIEASWTKRRTDRTSQCKRSLNVLLECTATG